MTQVTPIRDLKGFLELRQVEKLIAVAAVSAVESPAICTICSLKNTCVPELVSLESTTMGASLPPTSFQLVILLVKIAESCAIVNSDTGLVGWTTTERASLAT